MGEEKWNFLKKKELKENSNKSEKVGMKLARVYIFLLKLTDIYIWKCNV